MNGARKFGIGVGAFVAIIVFAFVVSKPPEGDAEGVILGPAYIFSLMAFGLAWLVGEQYATSLSGHTARNHRSHPGSRLSRAMGRDAKIAVAFVVLVAVPLFLYLVEIQPWFSLLPVDAVIGVVGIIRHRRRRKAEGEQQRVEEEQRLAEEERRRQEQEKSAWAEETRRTAQERRHRIEGRKQAAEEAQRRHVESLLRRDATLDEIGRMSGLEFEKFMAGIFRQQGYAVQETRATGDQGVDLLLPDLDGKRVAIQLKRWTVPVGNAAVQATFGGMAYYQAEEGWIITTSSFTKAARDLARSTSVRLIDGKELAGWLEGLKEEV